MLEVRAVRQDRVQIRKVSNRHRLVNPQRVGFNKYLFFFHPCHESVLVRVEFNLADRAFAQHVTADYDVLLLRSSTHIGRNGEKLFKIGFVRREWVLLNNQLGLIGWINNNNGRFMFNELGEESAHAGCWVKLSVGTRRREIDSHRIRMRPFDRRCFTDSSLESFRLVTTGYSLKWGVGGLGGRHGGIIRRGHRPTRIHVEKPTGRMSDLEF